MLSAPTEVLMDELMYHNCVADGFQKLGIWNPATVEVSKSTNWQTGQVHIRSQILTRDG